MFGLLGSAIEVVLGLSFVYFLLSLICSHVSELLSGLFKLRARDLERGVNNLLCDPDIATAVLKHPLIKALGSTNSETPFVRWCTPSNMAGSPSYMPARTFALALFETLVPATSGPVTVERLQCRARALANGVLDEVRARVQHMEGLAPATRQQLLAAMPAGATTDEARAAIVDLANDVPQARKVLAMTDNQQSIGKALLSLIAQSASPNTLLVSVEDMRQLVTRLPETPEKSEVAASVLDPSATLDSIRRTLLLAPESTARAAVLGTIDAGQATLEAVRASVEGWYDGAMDRVSGIYKRRIQIWLLSIATLVTLALGADTLQMISILANNPAARAEVAKQAADAGVQPAPPNLDVPATTSNLHVMFGYRDAPPFGEAAWWLWVGTKLPGLLLTIVAVSLGAPF
ncbi:hypothetical protein SE17_34050, partial [Kouleothrix aurantiaca]